MPLRRRESADQPAAVTLGGQKLRALRQRAGISLVDLAADLQSEQGKTLDAGHINRMETGRISKPQIQTLEMLLDGLHATYQERREVLEAFGYQAPMTLPNDQAVGEAIKLAAYELHDSTYPVCLIDHGQRLWAWNRYAPRLVGLQPDDPATARFIGVTLFDLTFNPALETRLLIANPDEYLPAMLQFIKVGTYQFRNQLWHQEMIARASAFPEFRALWDSTPFDTPRSVVPISIRMADATVLQFRLSSSALVFDPRFVLVHFTPFGATTLRACADWASEEGVL